MPNWLAFAFVFATGCCIGSFLNVVVYRLPRGKSLVFPGSACPQCGKAIRWYDNIPLLSWLVLRARCRNCKAPISARYFLIELLTGLVFLGMYVAYFRMGLRSGMPAFAAGGGLVYLTHIVLLCALIAASAIDLESWIIPLSICWFVTGAALASSAVGVSVLTPGRVREYGLFPLASGATGGLAAGAAAGLAISLALLGMGLIRRSYEQEEDFPEPEATGGGLPDTEHVHHRVEILREVVFLAPVVICAVAAWWVTSRGVLAGPWARLMGRPAVAGFLGSAFGYFVGCGVVWATRILGTLAFGKEAMGLGDVHLMGAAGAVLGPGLVVLAFFIAPFFGLAWALTQMLSKKIRQIPYGPFLSMGILVVMLWHDSLLDRLTLVLSGP